MFNVSEVICTLSDVVRLAILLLIHAESKIRKGSLQYM